ncbi:MAG: GatB/YqeY domain-containing protein [Bacteroidales bacterium]|nr:GatB/YqeY domain-containing protein [Bacteroidales bacterium]
MSYFDQISKDIMAAMKARETVKLDALRGIKKEFIEAKTAKGANADLDDGEAMKIMKKMVKQRRDTAKLYIEQGRADLAEVETQQADVIESYLPAAMSAEELENKVKAIIEKVGASTMKDMGKVMGVASKELAGLADGKDISDCVKRLLS